MNECKIIKCNCVSLYQDNQYGQGKRVANILRKRDKKDPDRTRCTVCGKTN